MELRVSKRNSDTPDQTVHQSAQSPGGLPTVPASAHSCCALAGLTCGGAAVLGVLGEGNGPLDAIPLHLLDGLLGQGVHVAEPDVVLVRSCQGRSTARVRTHTDTASHVSQTDRQTAWSC